MPKQENHNEESLAKELSLVEIMLFLNDSRKTILAMGFMGFLFAFVFLWLTPSQYEANALIRMARTFDDKKSLWVNVEEPAFLVSRMLLSGSLDEEVISTCDLDKSLILGGNTAQAIKFSIPKGSDSIVELKVIRANGELARACAQAIYDQITASQALINAKAIQEIEYKLSNLNERLEFNKLLLSKFDFAKIADSPSYYSILHGKRVMEDELNLFKRILEKNNLNTTQLLNPIRAGNQPVYPKKIPILTAGILCGLFFGLFVAIGIHIFKHNITLVRKQSDNS